MKARIPILSFLLLALIFSCKSVPQSDAQSSSPVVVPETETWVSQSPEPEEIVEVVDTSGIDEEIPQGSGIDAEAEEIPEGPIVEEMPEIAEAPIQEEAQESPVEVAEESVPLPEPPPIEPQVVQPPAPVVPPPPATSSPVQPPAQSQVPVQPAVPPTTPPVQPPPATTTPPATSSPATSSPAAPPPVTATPSPPATSSPVQPPVQSQAPVQPATPPTTPPAPSVPSTPPVQPPPATPPPAASSPAATTPPVALPPVTPPPAPPPTSSPAQQSQVPERTTPSDPPLPPPFLGPAEPERPPPVRQEVPPPLPPELPSPPRNDTPETSIVFSRVVRMIVGQMLEVPFRGTGWVYQGELGNRRGINYDSTRTDTERGVTLGQSIIFRAETAGTYILRFYRRDYIQDYIINDYVQVIVGEANDSGRGRTGAVIDRGRVVAEPRWPSVTEVAGSSSETVSPPAVAGGATTGTTVPGTTAVPQRPDAAQAAEPASPAVSGSAPAASAPSQSAASPPVEVVPPDEYVRRAKQEFDAGRVEQALAIIEQMKQSYPSGTDEVWWLLGQLYEANSPVRDIRQSLECYRTLVNEYPQSNRIDDARRRIAYLERYYLNIR